MANNRLDEQNRAACGVSKPNLYNITRTGGLLFDVIRFHPRRCLKSSKLPIIGSGSGCAFAPVDRSSPRCVSRRDSQHNVQISSLRFLSASRQAELEGDGTRVVGIFSDAVRGVSPHLEKKMLGVPIVSEQLVLPVGS